MRDLDIMITDSEEFPFGYFHKEMGGTISYSTLSGLLFHLSFVSDNINETPWLYDTASSFHLPKEFLE